MRVYELDSLADWFKENVLEIHQAEDDINAEGAYGLSTNDEVYSEAFDDAQASLIFEQAQEQDDQISLIEYIIGIDEIET